MNENKDIIAELRAVNEQLRALNELLLAANAELRERIDILEKNMETLINDKVYKIYEVRFVNDNGEMERRIIAALSPEQIRRAFYNTFSRAEILSIYEVCSVDDYLTEQELVEKYGRLYESLKYAKVRTTEDEKKHRPKPEQQGYF
jgi:hypothetical protein